MGMSLDDDIASFLAEAEARPAPSKLEPYGDLIRTLRQRRWTFVEIATALHERFSLRVAPSTIHNFVKVRAHKKNVVTPTVSPTPLPKIQPAPRPRFNLDA